MMSHELKLMVALLELMHTSESNVDCKIIGPIGEMVAAANEKDEDILIQEFDLDKIKSQRHSWGVFRDRRPDLYKVLLTLDGNKPSS